MARDIQSGLEQDSMLQGEMVCFRDNYATKE
jgi:hypothetical protein